MANIFVIFDGDCRFCIESLRWVEQRVELDATPYQQIDFEEDQWVKVGITYQQCQQEVVLLTSGLKLSGADAIAFLLNARGNTRSSWMAKKFGRLSHLIYRWVARNRNSLVIRLATRYLRYSNKKFY
jgi:predicted DCC family thiol-disulfide oxidoreductase YuxK